MVDDALAGKTDEEVTQLLARCLACLMIKRPASNPLEVFTAAEVAAQLKLKSEDTIYEARRLGEIGFVTVGHGDRNVRFTREHIDDYVAAKSRAAVDSPVALRRRRGK